MHEGHAEAERTANSFKPIFFGGGLMMIDEKHGCIYHWGDSPHGRITARDNMERMLREAHPAFDIQSGASPPGYDENFARQK